MVLVLLFMVWVGTHIANPIDKEDIIGDAEQIQLTNMRASTVDVRARGKELQCTALHWRAYLSVGFVRNQQL